ncbi:hypothetical protein SAMN05518849_11412 [Sphingobium sp. AP50]|nr:hypothetical protein SAMN05518849_11412 [Sphingobium sp. AP50]
MPRVARKMVEVRAHCSAIALAERMNRVEFDQMFAHSVREDRGRLPLEGSLYSQIIEAPRELPFDEGCPRKEGAGLRHIDGTVLASPNINILKDVAVKLSIAFRGCW